MFLLPGAERYRRVLLTGAVVGLLTLQAVLQQPQIEGAVNRVLAPVQKPLAGLAGTLDGILAGGSPTVNGSEAIPSASALVAMERRLGLPEAIPGMAWLEVPVWSLDLERGRLVIAAGTDFHLAEGQVVAFGNAFLGRLGEVREHSSDVELWSAAGLRTGVSVIADVRLPIRAVCFGRGSGGAAVVEWSEDETGHAEDRRLMWRPRPLDPPVLEQSGLSLGVLKQEGDASRGEASWVVEHAIPAGAHGRVFIAAGAVGTTLIAEPSQRKQSASLLLSADAILGDDWYALASNAGFVPTVSTDRGKVNGEVLTWRSQWGWARRHAPAAWADRAVALHLEENDVLNAEAWKNFEQALPLFTRGGSDLPRGLWIGYQDEDSNQPVAALEVLRLDVQEESSP